LLIPHAAAVQVVIDVPTKAVVRLHLVLKRTVSAIPQNPVERFNQPSLVVDVGCNVT
jgi:hypothetical protein